MPVMRGGSWGIWQKFRPAWATRLFVSKTNKNKNKQSSEAAERELLEKQV